MDLVAGVRKEGSRGGRGDFKWEDVKESQHRENYLGHSIMAPVGRWQKGRDLQWYAKAKQSEADKAQTEREEEIRRIKEAEQEAMACALGLPVALKPANANLTPLGGKEVQKVVQETTAANDEDAAGEGGRGVGFGSYRGGMNAGDQNERLEAVGIDPDERLDRKDKRDRSRERRDRSRDRDKDRERRHHRHHHHHDRERHRHERRHRSRSRSRSHDRAHRRRRSPSRSRSRDRRRDDDYERPRRRERSYSPGDRHEHRHHRRERDVDYERRR
ncbi:kinase phosphorylation protein-domain-containing protein [Thermoascus aurantiacus ATCC 26904]